jgi:hypothetical protein
MLLLNLTREYRYRIWLTTRSGMACRLGFDLGLNLDTTQLGLTEQEVQIRHMVLWACAVYDK